MRVLRGILAPCIVAVLLLAACDSAREGDEVSAVATGVAAVAAPASKVPADGTAGPGGETTDLDGLLLAPDGLGLVRFGDPADEVLALLEERLGEPDEMSDWLELLELSEPLPGKEHRYADEEAYPSVTADLPLHRDICWAMLCIHVAGMAVEDAAFTSWQMSLWRDDRYAYGTDILPPPPTPALRTPQGLSVGTTFAQLQEALGSDVALLVFEGGAVAFEGIPGWEPIDVGGVLANGTLEMELDQEEFEPTGDGDAIVTSLGVGTSVSYTCC